MIYVVSHKLVELPKPEGYQPLYVGACGLPVSERRSGWSYDDDWQGSISQLNGSFCELTGLKWIAERGRGDIVGLVHYRRFFAMPADEGALLSCAEAESLLRDCDCLVAPAATCLVYAAPVTVAQHYREHHCSTDLSQMLQVIDCCHPAYARAARKVLMQTSFHPFNMLVCKKVLLERYAKWLFSVLGHLAERIDPERDRDAYQRRVFGFLAERLFEIWLVKNKVRAREVPVASFQADEGMFAGSTMEDAQFARPQGRFDAGGFKPVVDGLDYSPAFDVGFYRAHCGDVSAVFHDDPQAMFEHFLSCGIDEGRQAHPRFSIASYANGNPRLRELCGGDRRALLRYYLEHPGEGTHLIGYENLFKEVEGAPPATPEERRRARYLARAEARGVID